MGLDVELDAELIANVGEMLTALLQTAEQLGFARGGGCSALRASSLAAFSALAFSAAAAFAASAALYASDDGSRTLASNDVPSLTMPRSCLMLRMVFSGTNGMAALNARKATRAPMRMITRNAAATTSAASHGGMTVARPKIAATTRAMTSKDKKTSATPTNAPATPRCFPLPLSSSLAKLISSLSCLGASRAASFRVFGNAEMPGRWPARPL